MAKYTTALSLFIFMLLFAPIQSFYENGAQAPEYTQCIQGTHVDRRHGLQRQHGACTLGIAGENAMPPHLIQTVTEQEIYEGMLSLGMLECPVLKEVDCEEAFENVKDCVVRIDMGNAYGSGMIWKMTADQVIVVTNRHVLDYWRDVDSYVYFPQGYYVDAYILGVSETQDVGFLAVDNSQLSYHELESLKSVFAEVDLYERLMRGDEMFCVGIGSDVGEILFYEGTVEDVRYYIEDLEAYMLYGHGFARAGMSGGGIFDGYGHLIGMITGGTGQNEVAGVPVTDLVEVFAEIAGLEK